MRSITLKLTSDELRLLATLASDQLFRKEFIDPRMPGNRSNAAEISLGKALVGRLRLMVQPASAGRALAPRVALARVTPRLKGSSGATP
jgi:hypothetical protein